MRKKPDVYELKIVRVSYGRLLHFRETSPEIPKEVNLPNPIQIPFGSVSQIRDYRFFVKWRNLESYEVFAIPNNNPMEEIQIYPGFEWKDDLDTAKFGPVKV